MSDASLAEIAGELYAAPPGDFTAARNARAAEAADREEAARIRALKKPSIAAWVVNVFAHERADELGRALELAHELREAQAGLDAAILAQLGRQRRALTNTLAQEAVALAAERGGRVSASTAEAVRQTIAAAFFDPDAAAAVASGRLVRELEPSGAFPLDAIAAVGAPAPVSQAAAGDTGREAAVRAAERELQRAQREHAAVELRVADLARRIDELGGHEARLQADLARVRDELAAARAEASGAEDRRAATGSAVAAAEQALAATRHPQA